MKRLHLSVILYTCCTDMRKLYVIEQKSPAEGRQSKVGDNDQSSPATSEHW